MPTRHSATCALLLLSAFVPSQFALAGPKTIYVEDRDLQAAIDAAAPYSVLVADKSRRMEITKTIRVTKPLTLVGLNARLRPGLGNTPILEVLAEGVRIRDFILEGNADSVEQPVRAPLILMRRGRFVVENGETNNSAKDGIMITPIAEYGDIEHGVVRNLTSRGTVRDTVSIGGAGDLGFFVRHLVVENIRAFDSRLRGPAEVSDGSEYITVRDIYAESCFYGLDIQDHNRAGQINRHVMIDGVHVKNCQTAIRTANHDFGHDGLTIRNVRGSGWREGSWTPVDIKNTANVLLENVHLEGCIGAGALRVRNSDNVTMRNVTVMNCGSGETAVLLEDVNDALVDNLVIEGTAWPRIGLIFRVAADKLFRGLRIHNVLAGGARDAGIVLENTSKSGGLDSYMVTGNMATVRAGVPASRRLVADNLPGPGEK